MRVAFRKWLFPPVFLKQPPPTSDRNDMLGGFQFVSGDPTARACARLSGPFLAGVLAALFLVGPAAAEPEREPRSTRSAAADARVSMSPDANEAAVSPAPPSSPLAEDSSDTTPLTRAAARRRVESISPVHWLTRFGPVSLERHE